MNSPTEPSTNAAPHLPLDARTLIDRYGVRAKKSWSQNFLVDPRTYRAIVSACQLSEQDTAVEIGAGLGTLTSHLLLTGAQVIAVERERDMCAILQRELGAEPRLRLLTADALQLKLNELLPDEGTEAERRLVVVGNLPYQIASPLLFQLLAQRMIVRRIVVMIQREVADRLLASVGTDAYSSMSAQVQMLARVEHVCHVGRGAFIPAPRVESTVVRLIPYATSAVPVRSLNNYATVVRAGFGQRRKMLRNSLAAQLNPAAMAALEACGIDLSRRAETLSLSEFARLADALPDEAVSELR
ncbi:MAG TPA: 16S rRNA (adenine(1518)-N(6)/adenine(1519)-N(6))-dimethyltransferase RsmA [Pseudomonadota bacterium]|nr:16S rRNA (adenine(1518)-N(6)/adenine(1519)-N(6))-dimethyltransferase RsmA [Pseudomonadota bacterium]